MNAEAEVLDAVRAAGFAPQSAAFLGGWRTGRATYRVTLADGPEPRPEMDAGLPH